MSTERKYLEGERCWWLRPSGPGIARLRPLRSIPCIVAEQNPGAGGIAAPRGHCRRVERGRAGSADPGPFPTPPSVIAIPDTLHVRQILVEIARVEPQHRHRGAQPQRRRISPCCAPTRWARWWCARRSPDPGHDAGTFLQRFEADPHQHAPPCTSPQHEGGGLLRIQGSTGSRPHQPAWQLRVFAHVLATPLCAGSPPSHANTTSGSTVLPVRLCIALP